jgi:isoleucyl-tRNA synthetase
MTQSFPEVKALNQPALEREILAFWEQERIFERCISHREGGPDFTFYEGPPTANGRPGIHHVLSRTIKDLFCRYKTLKGYRVERKAGWDTHGLPVEIEVEKELGLDGRAQVETYGIAAFNQACRNSVNRYTAEWNTLTRQMGYWVDLEHPYVTYHNEYIESVWWLIKRIYERGLLYKGYKIAWYSPGTGTVLSSHEVSLGYKEVTDPSAYVRFRLVEDPATSLLAWTTTPWTLLSNVALAVGPSITYVKVRITGESGAEQLILAEARLESLRCEYEILERMSGRALAGLRYSPLFQLPDVALDGNPWRVVTADYVAVEDGTGIVHIAPAFGAEDYDVGQREGLPLVNPVGPDGKFTDAAPLVAGLWFKDANRVVNRDLTARGLLYRQDSYLHNYPHDWRKGTPLMSYPVESWFIRTTAVKDRLVALNQTINWQPPAIRDGRFGNWLENNVDWALSRKRYWGTPLPIWVSDAPGSSHFEVIGSIAELREKCGQLPDDATLDLHRPFVDDLTWPAPDGGTMRRVPDVLDVWFDSGAMPFAQWHYPFENKEVFERNFPADFICEGVDQTRGWFYTLHAIATLVMDNVAFRNVVVNGLILDEKGEKMSKSKGNTIDPFKTVGEYGADVVRWYLMANSPPWDNMKFAQRGLAETRNKFFSTLENSYRFFASYANIDGFRFQENPVPPHARTELDRWILSRLHSTVLAVDTAYAEYDATRAARALEEFIEELSNWYIRRSRPRFWAAKKSGSERDGQEKLCAYQTTFECLDAVARMMSPLAPFFGDWLFRALRQGAAHEAVPSVHMADFPAHDPGLVDPALETRMGLARTVVSLVLLLRNKAKINVRQPLQRILLVEGLSGVRSEVVETVRDIILDEVNIRDIEFIQDAGTVVRRSAKANFKRLGGRLGKRMKTAAALIAALEPEDINAFLRDGTLVLDLEGEPLHLDAEDLEILSEEVGGWSVAQEGRVTVALDTAITDELRQQGFARELVNRIQQMRKALDLPLTERIAVEIKAPAMFCAAIGVMEDYVKSEVLAVSLAFSAQPAGTLVEEVEIGDSAITVGLMRLGASAG